MNTETSYNSIQILSKNEGVYGAGRDVYFNQPVVLAILTITYITILISFTSVYVHYKKTQYCEEINKYSNSKRTGDRICLSYFIFLLLCISFRLLESVILLFNALDYSDSIGIKIWLV